MCNVKYLDDVGKHFDATISADSEALDNLLTLIAVNMILIIQMHFVNQNLSMMFPKFNLQKKSNTGR